MPDITQNLGLIKPGENEYYQIEQHNTNMDTLDTHLGAVAAKFEGAKAKQALQADKASYADLAGNANIPATMTYAAGNFAVVADIPAPVVRCTLLGYTTQPYAEGDTMTLNGVPVTLTDLTGEPLSDGAWGNEDGLAVPVQLMVDLSGGVKRAFFKKGGGAGLNFRVLQIPAAGQLPTAAKENDIAIFTDVVITQTAFDGGEPIAPTEGMVWLYTYNRPADVTFNASKDDKVTINLTALGVRQYISGAWQGLDAHIYLGGAWQTIARTWLYDMGNEYQPLTGGYVKWGDSYNGGAQSSSKEDTYIQLYAKKGTNTSATASVTWGTNLAIPIGNLKKIKIGFEKSGDIANYLEVRGIIRGTKAGSDLVRASMTSVPVGNNILEIDVQNLTNNYFIGFGAHANDGPNGAAGGHTIQIRRIWGEF